MHRCSSGFLFTLIFASLTALSGCLGNSSNNPGNGGVKSVSINPSSSISIDTGGTQAFTASALDANGRAVPGVNIQFVVSVPSGITTAPPLSLTGSGGGCAGTWDINGTICSPGNPGVALVNAVANGVSSATTTVYVHQHIASIQVQSAESQPPLYDCFSQGQTWIYKGIATNAAGQDITNTVGPMSWSFTNVGVLTAVSYVPPGQPDILNQVQITAKSPGVTRLFATVGGTTSTPFFYTTCLVQYVRLQINGQGSAGNNITVNNGTSTPITATVVDTIGNLVKTPPLTWSTSNAEVAGFSTTTNTTGTNNLTARNNEGGAAITASCTPPSCNIGFPGLTPPPNPGQSVPSLPIYASDGQLPNSGTPAYGSISVNVQLTPNTKAPTYTAWATTTGCENQSGCTSALFAVTPGLNPVGTILTLPRTPNSMMFNHQSSPRLYIGSDQGLMYTDVSGSSPTVTEVSSQTTPCNVTLCGKVLTVSNDGKFVVVSDTISTPNQVYIFNGSTTGATAPVDLVIPNEIVTAAAFSPDQLKIFLITNTGSLYVYSTVDPLTPVTLATTATDVKFSPDGSFAYVAGAPTANSITAFATCNTPTTDVLNPVGISFAPYAIYASPAFQIDKVSAPTQMVVALDPPNVDTFGVNLTQTALKDGTFTCTPPAVTLDANFPKTTVNLGLGNFVPLYAQLTNDGTELIIVAQNIPAVIEYNVFSGQVSSIPLVNTVAPQAASASNDGSQIFVASCDQYDSGVCSVGSVHTVSGGVDLQPPAIYHNPSNNNDTNMCNNGGNPVTQCLPNMIAIRPQ